MIKITMLFNKRSKGLCQKGVTLVELVMAIVVLGFVALSLTKLFGDVSTLGTQPDFRQTAVMLGQELMEEIKSRRFDELDAKTDTGNWSDAMGPDTGETAGDKSTYDDVDDFDGLTENMSSPFAGFTRTVGVDYVAANDLNTALTIPSPITDDWTPEFKRVQVVVSKGSISTTLVTVVGSARSRNTY
ncbi:MAG: prepilin-type N-terminal cleavage/methylation domain-containing protein [Candidatus Omnitrophica bacterium]|nr:prepilin-type N-terminal cleavage/methylation domain-containing protein [Candidatus Omnitrophota bacterium]